MSLAFNIKVGSLQQNNRFACLFCVVVFFFSDRVYIQALFYAYFQPVDLRNQNSKQNYMNIFAYMYYQLPQPVPGFTAVLYNPSQLSS